VSDVALREVLTEIVRLLEDAAIPHMVVGSFASTTHGIPRTTHDLDLVIDPSPAQLDQFVSAIDLDRYYVDVDVARDALRRRSMFNIIDTASAWKVDIVIRKQRRFSVEELARRQREVVVGVAVPIATAEDTILAKLEWAKAGSSERQLDDVAGILDVRGNELDLDYIERWLDELGVRDLWDRVREASVR